jgi:hypothetical protein
MVKQRKSFPKMNCVGYQPPQFSHENKAGMSFYIYYCEGCGTEKTIPDIFALDPNPPMFFGLGRNNDGCGCTKRKELTDYSDPCKECTGPIYLTPGAAMYRKISGSAYEQSKEYCESCLDRIVFSGKCRNLGCNSIGGLGIVEATFGEQLSYAKKNFTFPPNNCPKCRKAVKAFKERQEVRPTCRLCKKSFRVTYGVMIMILKNEEKCETPKECLRCRGLSPDDRRRLEQENALGVIGIQRRREVAKLLLGNKDELKLEKERRAVAKEEKNREFRKRLQEINKLTPVDLRALLHQATKDALLLTILSNPNDPKYGVLRNALAHATGGKAAMTETEYEVLPQAFRLVVEKYPKTMGLFEASPKYRGKGSSALHQHYEILSTAALMNTPATSRSGKELFINYQKDMLDFGAKISREANVFNDKGVIENLFGLKSRTIEADALVVKPDGTEIAIDAKYTSRSEYKNVPYEQLRGIREGFNLGKFDKFYFVTNKAFSGAFINEVTNTNLQLVRDYVSHEGIPEPHELGNLDKYDAAVKEFVKEHHIEQIEMCEYVNYLGT